MMFSTHTCLLLLSFLSFLGAEKPGCKIVILEEVKCHTDLMPIDTPGCETECETVTVDDCKDEEAEECTTEHDTVCDDKESDGRIKTSTVPAMKVKATLARAGIATDILDPAKHGADRMKRSPRFLQFLPGRAPFPLPFPILAPIIAGGAGAFGALGGGGGGAAFVGLGLAKLKIIKLLKLKHILKKAGLIGLVGLTGLKKKKGDEEETCFEIPRTVCEAPHYKKPETNHYTKREAEPAYGRSNCHTTVQTVCGANANEQYRKKRSVADGCTLVPISQHCMKKEPRRVCKKVEKEVCSDLPKGCYKEMEVCGPEKVMKEVCS